MRVVSTQILNAANDVTRTGAAVDTNQWINVTFQTINGDATAAGTVKIQGSNDNGGGVSAMRANFTPINWSDIPNATATVVAGIAPLIVLENVACQYMRAVFTKSVAGSTTITVQANAVSV